MIPARRKRPKMNVRESAVIRSPSFLQWVRGHNCTCVEVDPSGCEGDIEAEQHRIGEQSFEARYKFSMRTVADRLWRRWLSSTDAGRRFAQASAQPTTAIQVGVVSRDAPGDEDKQ